MKAPREEEGTHAIAKAFCAARRAGRPALITYLTLGYPTPAASLELVPALEEGGADIIELGLPFSDPVADGPAIQRATYTALQAGITTAMCLQMVGDIRAGGLRTPLLFMGYYNPILQYGPAAFVHDSAAAGVDGLIIADLPPEEADDVLTACRQEKLALVFLATPTTPICRLAAIARATSGFLYLVSRLGTTGAGQGPDDGLVEQIAQARHYSQVPVAVGFGISGPTQAASLVGLVDGIIVGSAIVERAQEGPDALRAFTATIRASMKG